MSIPMWFSQNWHSLDSFSFMHYNYTLQLYRISKKVGHPNMANRRRPGMSKNDRHNIHIARKIWNNLSREALGRLTELAGQYKFSVVAGDLTYMDNGWYVTHTGLLGLARRSHCAGIHVKPVPAFCDASAQRWAFAATVYKSRSCRGFVGYGDADPFNVSPSVRGAELRIAETRAVNRALRKAYGIGICSVEELGFVAGRSGSSPESKKLPQPTNGNGYGGRTVRDPLCQLIRQHQLDATLVKSYATDFCGVRTLREATREQVENFVAHLANWAEKNRDALLCQLNSYLGTKEGAA